MSPEAASSAAAQSAATVVILRDGDSGIEVLMLRRHAKSGFMANAYVFPGGRVESADSDLSFVSYVDAHEVARMEALPHDVEPLSFWIAAIRETFEESGLLFAVSKDAAGSALEEAMLWASQQRLNSKEITFAEMLSTNGLIPDFRRLTNLSHWVTPAFESRRYSARFFCAKAYDTQISERVDGVETTDACWLRPVDALEQHAAKRLRLAPPQWVTLRLLMRFHEVDEVLTWAQAQPRIHPCEPELIEHPELFALALPGDPEHSSSPGSATLNRVVLRDGVWCEA
jgi:8-oxo-dGTP pyrophosphatase MutT (NUDIX family)